METPHRKLQEQPPAVSGSRDDIAPVSDGVRSTVQKAISPLCREMQAFRAVRPNGAAGSSSRPASDRYDAALIKLDLEADEDPHAVHGCGD